MPSRFGYRDSDSTLRPPRKDEDFAVCGSCGCSWFEEIKPARIMRNQLVLPGQSLQKVGETYILARCVRCGELHEPPSVSTHVPGYKLYIDMIQEIDKKEEEK